MTRKDLLPVYKLAKAEWVENYAAFQAAVVELGRLNGPMQHFSKAVGIKVPTEITEQVAFFALVQRSLKRWQKAAKKRMDK